MNRALNEGRAITGKRPTLLASVILLAMLAYAIYAVSGLPGGFASGIEEAASVAVIAQFAVALAILGGGLWWSRRRRRGA